MDKKIYGYKYGRALRAASTNKSKDIGMLFTNLKNRVSDFIRNVLSMPHRVTDLRSLSNEISARTSKWAVIPACEYSRNTKTLMVELLVIPTMLVDRTYVYTDDDSLISHISFRAQKIYGIISRYLQAPMVNLPTIRIVELHTSKFEKDMSCTQMFHKIYSINSDGCYVRNGMPAAVTILLTYSPVGL